MKVQTLDLFIILAPKKRFSRLPTELVHNICKNHHKWQIEMLENFCTGMIVVFYATAVQDTYKVFKNVSVIVNHKSFQKFHTF